MNDVLLNNTEFPVALWIEPPQWPFAFQGCAAGRFKIFLYSNDNNSHDISLYSQGSKSEPHKDITNRLYHLSPRWYFTDIENNIIEKITLKNAVTAMYGDTMGYISSGEFIYIDDLPTPISEPVIIWAVADFSAYPVEKDNSRANGYSNSKVIACAPYYINKLEPDSIRITRDGISDLFNYYWKGAPITHIMTINGKVTNYDGNGICTPIIKNIPSTNDEGLDFGNFYRSFNRPITSITWTPDVSSFYLSAFNKNDYIAGGYAIGTATIPYSIDNLNIEISGRVFFEDEPIKYPYIWISNPSNNTINRLFVPFISSDVINREDTPFLREIGQQITDITYLQVSSVTNMMGVTGFHGIYGIALDERDKTLWCTDSESNKIYKFNPNGVLLSSINLEEDSTPVNIVLDGADGAWVTLHDSPSIIKIDINSGNILNTITSPYMTKDVWVIGNSETIVSGPFTLPPTSWVTDLEYPIDPFISIPRSGGRDADTITAAPNGVILYNMQPINEGWVSINTPPLTANEYILNSPLGRPSLRLRVEKIQLYDGDDIIKPVVVDTDANNDIWASFQSNVSGFIVKYSSSGALLSAITLPAYSNPTDLYITKDNDVWISLSQNAGPPYGETTVRKYNGTTGVLMSSISAVNPYHIIEDYDNSLWFTQKNNILTKYTTAGDVFNWDVGLSGNISSPAPNGIFNNILAGLCYDEFNRIWVINTCDNNVYTIINNQLYMGSNIQPDEKKGFYNINGNTYIIENDNNTSIRAIGDWSGKRWAKKYGSNTSETRVLYLSGMSNGFDVCDYGNLSFRKFNESWDATNELKKYARTPQIADNPVLWDKYMKSVWGDSSLSCEKTMGIQAYEKISNFTSNHSDIDTCNIPQLRNLSKMLDVSIDEFGVEYPASLKRIMDLVSVEQRRLWGTRCQCSNNIENSFVSYLSGDIFTHQKTKCIHCNHTHPGNRGDLFNPETYMISSFKEFIIEDRMKTKNNFHLLTPPILSNNLSSYALSSHYDILPYMNGSFDDIKGRFCFYDYIPFKCNQQVSGIIEWDNEYTTLTENISTMADWYGDDGIIEKIISYDLHNGLGLLGNDV